MDDGRRAHLDRGRERLLELSQVGIRAAHRTAGTVGEEKNGIIRTHVPIDHDAIVADIPRGGQRLLRLRD